MDKQELSQEDITKVAAELDVLSNMFGPDGTGKTMKLASSYLMLLSAYVFGDNDKFEEISEKEDAGTVNDPLHHRAHAIECFDEMIEMFGREDVKSYCRCAAWKHRYRAQYEGDKKRDDDKADWYIAKLRELQDGESTE